MLVHAAVLSVCSRGYNELWSAYTLKFRDLINEISTGAPTETNDDAAAAKPKAKRKPRTLNPLLLQPTWP